MIRNIVFDLGNTLIRFEGPLMVSPYVEDAGEASLIDRAVFGNEHWARMDEGSLTDEDFLATVRARLPEALWQKAGQVYRNWVYHLPEIDGMGDLIRRMKREYGAHIFILSNISRYFAAHTEGVPLLREAEGCVFSGEIGCVKPDRRIYEHLCAKFGLKPAETVFVDDNPRNIDAARALGIAGYLFDGDAGRLSAWLDGILRARSL